MSAATFGISVSVDGQTFSVVPTAGDLVRLERQFGISASTMSEESTSVEHVLFLAWTGLRRMKLGPELDFEQFLDVADTVDESTLPQVPLPNPSV